MMKNSIQLLMFTLVLFLASCDGSKNVADNAKDAVFDNFENVMVCKANNYKKANLPDAKLKICFKGKFEESRNFTDFEVVSQNQETYYLIAKGMREGNTAQFAAELTEKDGELFLEDFNKLYYTCIARYCEGCTFKYTKDGTVGGCDCGEEQADKPKGYAACEHTIGIKTADKE